MTKYIYFTHPSSVEVWGITAEQRATRLTQKSCQQCTKQSITSMDKEDTVLILRGDYIFDDRLVTYLVSTENILLKWDDQQHGSVVVAAHVPAHLAEQAIQAIECNAEKFELPAVEVLTPATISLSFQQTLLKFEPPFVLPVSQVNVAALEKRLFDWSYKGITDLVTKWVWPTPARHVVKFCVNFNIRPNHVTLISLVLVILASMLFYHGHFGWGLLAGWLMTFLDTVDGKLARVTMTSSKFGHYFDHLIDLIHPPIWYIYWGIGLSATQIGNLDLSVATLGYIMLAGYIIGRLVEGSFNWFLRSSFSIFSWRPFDAYFRLITARRNPNMLILTLSLLAGRPELGFLAVTIWTMATSVVLLGRLLQANYVRSQQGSLSSWLVKADSEEYRSSLAARWFTKYMTK